MFVISDPGTNKTAIYSPDLVSCDPFLFPEVKSAPSIGIKDSNITIGFSNGEVSLERFIDRQME